MKRTKTIPDEQRFRSALKSRGLRATETRLSIHRAMMALEHASADQVCRWLDENHEAAASESSVYNVLLQMATYGIYSYLLSAEGKRYFDVCNFTHPHLYDRKNGVYKNLPYSELSEAVNDAFRNYRFRGYTVEDIDITVVCHPRGSSR